MATKKKPEKPMTWDERLEAYGGIEAVCEGIANTKSMTQIAHEIGIGIGALVKWIAADENRSLRAREERVRTALLWDERAVEVIESAADPFELSKAKELAHHYRWKASKIAPKDYGDKQEVVHSGQVDIANALAAARGRSGTAD